MKRKRARGHTLAGRGRPWDWSGCRKKSEYVRCTLAGEDNGTELMFPREAGQKTERKRATHLLESAEEGTGQDWLRDVLSTQHNSGCKKKESQEGGVRD